MLINKLRQWNFDWSLFLIVAFLLAFGMLAIYSFSSSSLATSGENIFLKQFYFLIIGLVLLFFFSWMDYHLFSSYSGGLYLLGNLLLLAVLFLGKEIRGTVGWFNFGWFNFQPAEAMKFFLIISLANFFSQKGRAEGINLRLILISFIYLCLPLFLVLAQPDFGSAMALVAIWLGMIFLAGATWKNLAGLFLIGLLAALLSWNFLLKDYQKKRVENFFYPERDALGSGYNVIQSVVAIGSGGISGKGIGNGTQSQLNFLPEKHTDFIFAAVAESGGLLSSFLLLFLFWLLFWRFKKVLTRAPDPLGFLLVGGIEVMLFFQILINIGMNLGLMPVAGLSLPFLSYGGSFLVLVLACLGIVQSVWKRRVAESVLKRNVFEF